MNNNEQFVFVNKKDYNKILTENARLNQKYIEFYNQIQLLEKEKITFKNEQKKQNDNILLLIEENKALREYNEILDRRHNTNYKTNEKLINDIKSSNKIQIENLNKRIKELEENMYKIIAEGSEKKNNNTHEIKMLEIENITLKKQTEMEKNNTKNIYSKILALEKENGELKQNVTALISEIKSINNEKSILKETLKKNIDLNTNMIMNNINNSIITEQNVVDQRLKFKNTNNNRSPRKNYSNVY